MYNGVMVCVPVYSLGLVFFPLPCPPLQYSILVGRNFAMPAFRKLDMMFAHACSVNDRHKYLYMIAFNIDLIVANKWTSVISNIMQ